MAVSRFEMTLNPASDARAAEMRGLYDSLIEWHCPGRHGVIRNVRPADLSKVVEMLTYFFGNRCCWRSGSDLEFVHMTKVFPAPKRPWEWCGTSVLFEDWKQREIRQSDARAAFRVGNRVRFEYKGRQFEGLIYGMGGKRCSIVIEGSEIVYYMPPTSLTKV
jgi:hypothetical protein